MGAPFRGGTPPRKLTIGAVQKSQTTSTGSYYTPDQLVQLLITSALLPVIADRLSKAITKKEKEDALLAIRVLDPACGSGHFLLAAARRLALELARIRAEDEEPSEELRQQCLRDVVAHCIYGVDKNPMAVELCKVALWIEAIEPGKPLSFLDAHIQCGDSLVGVFDPKVLEAGIPDEAYKPLTGDDKPICTSLKKTNQAFRDRGQRDLFSAGTGNITVPGQSSFDQVEEEDLAGVAAKEQAYSDWNTLPEVRQARLAANTYTSTFFLLKDAKTRAQIPTSEHLDAVLRGGSLTTEMQTAVEGAASEFRFLHWHLTFPEIMKAGGFDCVLGNPPWEMLEANSNEEKKVLGGQQNFVKSSGRYSVASGSRKNLYALFAELIWTSLSGKSYSGIIVPTSIAQDAPASMLIYDLVSCGALSSFIDIENKRRDGGKWFSDVHPNYRFSLITALPSAEERQSLFFFDVERPGSLDSRRAYSLSKNSTQLGSREEFRMPILRNSNDILLQRRLSECKTVASWLNGTSSIRLASGIMFNAEPAVKRLRVPHGDKREELVDLVQVLEGYNIHQFTSTYASCPGSDQLGPGKITTSFYLPKRVVEDRIRQICVMHGRSMLALRRQARSVDRFVSIAAVTPLCAAEGSLTCFFTDAGDDVLHAACAIMNSLMFNYLVARRQAGPNLNKAIWSSVPVPSITDESLAMLATFSKTLHRSDPKANESHQERAELEAFVFKEYLSVFQSADMSSAREVVEFILDEFQVLRSVEIRSLGEYRTQRLVLEAWDRLFGGG